MPIEAAAGRVLSEPAFAVVDLPAFPNSAMDGFALRAADGPGTLAVVGRIPAGRPAPRALKAGEAMAIATGGVLPDGADTVVPNEEAEDLETLVVVGNALPGANVRARADDISAGQLVVRKGTRLGAAQLGALAATGAARLRCARVPHVVLVVTGSELRTPGEPLAPGEIYDANGFIVEAQVRSTGATVQRLPPADDDYEATKDALRKGLEADVLVTTGGVSVGQHDLVRQAEAELGVEEVFWRVAVRPGEPVAFGVREPTLVFGLPGNPVATLVCFELFVRPALLTLQGVTDPGPSFRPARLASALRRVETRESFVRARARVVGDNILAEPLTGHKSHMIASGANADALILIPRGKGQLKAGASVSYLAL
ncbi:MAG: molybdopterin molybdotransferase MoeA [Actinomycetota bacterium]|nr:molybdopterin molybdotransferase MoeA [Actinomycetota bacterium]